MTSCGVGRMFRRTAVRLYTLHITLYTLLIKYTNPRTHSGARMAGTAKLAHEPVSARRICEEGGESKTPFKRSAA